jgi:hypothetical protein
MTIPSLARRPTGVFFSSTRARGEAARFADEIIATADTEEDAKKARGENRRA